MQTTLCNNCGIHRTGVVFFLLLASFVLSCSAVKKEGPLLDERVFTVITVPAGNPADAAMERISFANGIFDNDNCHLWGFGSGPYAASEVRDSITFSATTTSEKEGTMTWKGTVIGENLNGTMIWSKKGQEDLAYIFSNENIEIVDLNGKKFDVMFTPGDTATGEIISFTNGMFESPGCYAWGFSAAPYQAYMLQGKQHFQCTYTSEKEGTMLFYGVIDGGTISGTQFWTKPGQEDVYYSMKGSEMQ